VSATSLRVAVIGGGIGGLAASLLLLRAGCDVTLYEQAERFAEVGAGIQISPNASRLLLRVVPADVLTRHAVRPQAVQMRRWRDGRVVERDPLGAELEAAFGAPYFHLHRADLLEALASAMPEERVRFGHRFVALEEEGEQVAARFANGAVVRADLLVGADGIHSAVRAALFGPEHPRFTGCIAYRGLVPAGRLAALGLETIFENWMGPGRHFVHYFVAGGRLVNFVACIGQESWTREFWTDRGRIEDALAAFDGWHPQVRQIIGAVDETYIWALFDRPALPRWSVGRVTLLGDACHAMLPFMAQGAAQAIEDGGCLAACLAAAIDVPAALKRYETLRQPRATRLQEVSRANRDRFQLPDGPAQEARDREMGLRGDRSIAALGWLYGHDAEALA
jgi:salicylate hydroxylase